MQLWEPVSALGAPQEPVHPDPADAADAEPRPAPARRVLGLGLGLETAWELVTDSVAETASVTVPGLEELPVLMWLQAMVRHWAQGLAQGQPAAGP